MFILIMVISTLWALRRYRRREDNRYVRASVQKDKKGNAIKCSL